MSERLYRLLPAYLRNRDWYEGQPLKALLAALETQLEALDEGLEHLYDDLFIETCQERLAPYLGDLLGVRGLDTPEAWVAGQRARIANTLGYRRLKGTPAVLARVAGEVTGWSCRALPSFERLAATQALAHPRPGRGGFVSVRDRAALERLEGPFDGQAHTVQVTAGRAPRTAGPREVHGLERIGLYFWRLETYPALERFARPRRPGCYTFHPLGYDQPLFAATRLPERLTEAMGEADLPGPISRAALAEQLEDLRRGRRTAAPPVRISHPGAPGDLPWSAVAVADLSDWRRPRAGESVTVVGPDGSRAQERILAAVDPETGRLAFAEDLAPRLPVRVSYHYAMAGDLGGGPYERPRQDLELPLELRRAVAASAAAEPGDGFSALEAALEAWPGDAEVALVRWTDSATYGGWAGLELELDLPAGGWLVLEASPGECPAFVGDLRVRAPAGGPARLTLGGIAIGGVIRLEGPVQLELLHSTVMAADPGAGGRPAPAVEIVGAPAPAAALRVESSIVGPLRLAAEIGRVDIVDSVVDGGSGVAVAGDRFGAPGCRAAVTRTTVIGGVSVTRLEALDSLFTAPVAVRDPHLGRASHCFLPPGSRGPARRHCVGGDGEPAAGVGPLFTSLDYGQPGYAQLSRRTASALRSGASNGSEMGVFRDRGNPFREANLAGALDEYLPWGLEPRILYVT